MRQAKTARARQARLMRARERRRVRAKAKQAAGRLMRNPGFRGK